MRVNGVTTMLDLQKLEYKVDEMIANDAPEEMMAWLLKKKMEEFTEFLSDGIIEPMTGDLESKFINPVMVSKPKNKEPFISENYSKAA